MSLISSPVIQTNLGALMETIATIDPANIGNRLLIQICIVIVTLQTKAISFV